MNFHQKSKELHKQYRKEFWAGAFDPSHPDTMRHYELLKSSDGLLDHINPASILSVGDNLARDAGYFKKRYHNANCIASDLYVDGIQEAASYGYVDSVIAADVEKLPFGDSEIDCVIAKEAFHHWPRPMLGFYEMMRVAKKAVILIEPYDVVHATPNPFLDKHTFNDRYEEVGNYVYQISLREIIKSAWSLYYPAVAAVGFNDPYSPNQTFQQWQAEKTKLDSMGYNGDRQFNLMCIAVYKPGYQPSRDSLPSHVRLYQRPLNQYMPSDKL